MDLEKKIRSDDDEAEGEAWKQPHQEAMACRDFEDALREGMRLYRTLRDRDDAWSRRVQKNLVKFDPDVARDFRTRYEAWFAPCDWALQNVQKIEKDFGILEDAEEFRKARQIVRNILATPIEDVISSMSEIASGKIEVL